MKILVIGGNGTIGKPVSTQLAKDHEVIIADRSKSEISIDISDSQSIQQGLDKADKLDAIVCIAGEAKWASFNELSEADYYIGLRSKLMGQVNLVRIGKEYLNDGGSITLSTGILADDPVLKTASAAMVNGGIHSFVQAAALEMEREIRLNVVSLGMVEAAYEKYKSYFPGHNPISMDVTVNAYVRSIFGTDNGKVLRFY